jgi:uncharacterized protein (DUF58 family)
MPRTLALDASLLAVCDDLPLLARTIVEGFLSGLHASPFLGYSTEFDSFRPYIQGDSLRLIDWKLWSRTDRFYVKQFEDDTNLNGLVIVDGSASMDFGEGPAHKFETARVLAAALLYLMNRQRDAIGLLLWDAEGVDLLTPASHRHQVELAWQRLGRARPGGTTEANATVEAFVQRLTRRGIAVVLSDFLGPARSLLALCGALVAQRQEVVAFHVLSPEEYDFKVEGEALLVDPETGDEREVSFGEARETYLARFAAFRRETAEHLLSLGADYHELRTDSPLDMALFAYLERRNPID